MIFCMLFFQICAFKIQIHISIWIPSFSPQRQAQLTLIESLEIYNSKSFNFPGIKLFLATRNSDFFMDFPSNSKNFIQDIFNQRFFPEDNPENSTEFFSRFFFTHFLDFRFFFKILVQDFFRILTSNFGHFVKLMRRLLLRFLQKLIQKYLQKFSSKSSNNLSRIFFFRNVSREWSNIFFKKY